MPRQKVRTELFNDPERLVGDALVAIPNRPGHGHQDRRRVCTQAADPHDRRLADLVPVTRQVGQD
jgi:hypothetical protein